MNEELERVQVTIEQLEAKIDKAAKWEQLLANSLFNELVTEEYLGNDVVRLVMGLKPETDKNEVTNSMLFAKSAFSRYVAGVLEEGQHALYSLEENKTLQDEIDAGE